MPNPYRFATTAADAQTWLAEVAGVGVVAVDTETSGWDPLRDALRLIQVSAGGDHDVLVLDADRVDPRVLAPLLADASVLKVFHHGSFDLRFLTRAGLRVARVADTMLAQQLLDAGERGPGLGLADLAQSWLDMRLDKSVRASFADGRAFGAEQLRYAADDAVATWGVFDRQWRELVRRDLTEVARLEFAAMSVLADLQLRGVAFDRERWSGVVGEAEAELPARAEAVQQALVHEDTPRNLFGPEEVNLDSPEQVRAALARLGVEVDSTREHVLRDHAGNPAVAALLAYRQVSKVTSNWGGDWAARVTHPATGRVHADWRQIVGAGRIACSDPNLTQIPKEDRYRACFGGAPDRALVVADYSQQELRILAAVSADTAMTDVFQRGGDLHRTTATVVFDVDEHQVTPAQRAAAKALNFGLVYGMGPAGFARATGMTVQRAQDTMNRYFAAFPRVAAWLANAESSGRREGFARTPLGRRHTLPPGGSGTRVARNAPIQGAGADMTKLALAEVDRRLAARFGDGGTTLRGDGLVLVVHDELVAEVRAEDADEAASLISQGMAAAAARILGAVPAAVDVAVRPRWGACAEPA